MSILPAIDRALTEAEATLLRWLLEHSGDDARAMLPQVDYARVVGGCPCGCASFDVVVEGFDGPIPSTASGTTPDFYWDAEGGGICSVFLFTSGGMITGLEVWSVDAETDTPPLPAIDQLRADP